MFCKDKDKGFTMPCSMKWIYEIIAFLSLICSLFVVIITKKMIKINLIHRLILQIIISEILDEINVLLEIFNDSKGKHNFILSLKCQKHNFVICFDIRIIFIIPPCSNL